MPVVVIVTGPDKAKLAELSTCKKARLLTLLVLEMLRPAPSN